MYLDRSSLVHLINGGVLLWAGLRVIPISGIILNHHACINTVVCSLIVYYREYSIQMYMLKYYFGVKVTLMYELTYIVCTNKYVFSFAVMSMIKAT